jgi:hypothetical protein
MAGRASATVYDLSKLASDHDDVLYQWTFNIGAHGGMMDAASGAVNLAHAKHTSTVKEAEVLPGFDVSTLALRTYQDNPGSREVGAALQADGALNLMQSATVEYLFNVKTVANNSYILAGFNDAGSRRYYGQVGTSTVVRAYVHETAREILPGDDNQFSFSTDNWYYVALTFDPVDGQPNHTRMNAYVADLTAGDTSAVRTQSVWVPITPAATTLPTLGFGCLAEVVNNVGGGRYFVDGFVDQVSIYGTRLTVDEINAHVAAIHQEPDLRVDLDVFRNYPSVDPNWVPDASSWRNEAFLGQSPTTTTKNPSRGQYGFTFDPSAADGGQMLTLNRNESLRVADIGGGQDMSVEMSVVPNFVT